MARSSPAIRPNHQRHTSAGHSDAPLVILGALAIVIASAALGLAVNQLSPHRLPLFAATPTASRSHAPTLPRATPLPKGLSSINIPDARAALDKRLALFIDARPAGQYAEGHIPGALNLPADEFNDAFPRLSPKIEASPFLIVYCDGAECSDSLHVAEQLIGFGFRGTRVMVDGYRAWADAGSPVAKGSEP